MARQYIGQKVSFSGSRRPQQYSQQRSQQHSQQYAQQQQHSQQYAQQQQHSQQQPQEKLQQMQAKVEQVKVIMSLVAEVNDRLIAETSKWLKLRHEHYRADVQLFGADFVRERIERSDAVVVEFASSIATIITEEMKRELEEARKDLSSGFFSK